MAPAATGSDIRIFVEADVSYQVMRPYQRQERLLMVVSQPYRPLQFPNEGEVQFTLAPGGSLGAGELPAHLALKDVRVTLMPDVNTNKYARSKPQYMQPVSANSATDIQSMRIQSNVVSIRQQFRSEKEILGLIESIYFSLPAVLALEFRDAPTVASVTGKLNGVEFVWAYKEMPWKIEVTTKQIQEQHFIKSWNRLDPLLPQQNKRLFAALNYFHTASRLTLVGANPWEFTSEVLLNLCKVLQSLFPGPDNKSRDLAREGLAKLGYTSDEIEKWYIPAISLRSELDVAHVSLAELDQKSIQVVQKYISFTFREEQFRKLLLRVIDSIVAGTFFLPPDESGTRHLETIRRLSKYFPAK